MTMTTSDMTTSNGSGDAVFSPGQPYTYAITVTNEGEGNSSGSIVTDTLPAGLEDAEADRDGCSTADDATEETMGNSASVAGNEEDPNSANDAAEYMPVLANP